jgi:hypothetical protein
MGRTTILARSARLAYPHSLTRSNSRIRQVEHMLVKPAARVRCLRRTDDLQVDPAAWHPEDRPVQAVAAEEGSRTGSPTVSR